MFFFSFFFLQIAQLILKNKVPGTTQNATATTNIVCVHSYSKSQSKILTGQPIYEDLDNRNGQIAITNPGYNNNLNTSKHTHNTHINSEHVVTVLTHTSHKNMVMIVCCFLVNGHDSDLIRTAEQDFTSHTYQEIGKFA